MFINVCSQFEKERKKKKNANLPPNERVRSQSSENRVTKNEKMNCERAKYAQIPVALNKTK